MNKFTVAYQRMSHSPRKLTGKVLRRILGRQQSAAKRDEWFLNYQSDETRKLVGLRDKTNARLQLIRSEDVTGKRILDAGCNMGAISKHCEKLGAARVLGIDFDSAAVRRARDLYQNESTEFRCDDLDNPLATLTPVDTVMFLSVYGTKELENRNAILSRLAGLSQVMYFEGHHGDDPRQCAWNLLLYGGFQSIEFLGHTNDELRADSVGRPFFRCDRQSRNEPFMIEHIAHRANLESEFKAAVIGRSGAGKSHMASKFVKNSLLDGIQVLDDVADASKLSTPPKLILFDYRACMYLDQIDALFFLDVAENQRLARLRGDVVREDDYNAYLRSPPMRPNFLSFFRIDTTDATTSNR